MVDPVESALRMAVADLRALKVRWALIGGLAIAVRAVPRFTKDLDFAIAVADDPEAEGIVLKLRERGYVADEVLEQEYVKRMSGVRLKHGRSKVVIDLLFASSGIEAEVVAEATNMEVLRKLSIPVATTGHLIALKTLASRHKDFDDLENLIADASEADLDTARSAVKLIQARGFNREQDVVADLEKQISDIRP